MSAVYAALNGIQTVSGKVYPIVATEGTEFPFIVFERQSVSPTYTKDGVCSNDVQVTIKVVTSGYFAGLQIAESVYNAMWSIDSDNVTYADVQLLNSNEEYVNDAYVQTLNYTFKVFYSETEQSNGDTSTGTDPTPDTNENENE